MNPISRKKTEPNKMPRLLTLHVLCACLCVSVCVCLCARCQGVRCRYCRYKAHRQCARLVDPECDKSPRNQSIRECVFFSFVLHLSLKLRCFCIHTHTHTRCCACPCAMTPPPACCSDRECPRRRTTMGASTSRPCGAAWRPRTRPGPQTLRTLHPQHAQRGSR